jgi:hypothetical protein
MFSLVPGILHQKIETIVLFVVLPKDSRQVQLINIYVPIAVGGIYIANVITLLAAGSYAFPQ